MQPEVFFPYGSSNFEEIVRENFVFFDKTLYIDLLEKNKEKRVPFLRWRRFGKSLFVSMLEYYYDIFDKDKVIIQVFAKVIQLLIETFY
jgi:hypothetical protein